MIIWRGRGGVIALIVFACFLLADFASQAAYHDPSYLATHGWLRLVAFWVSAGIVFALRSWLGVGKDRTVIDKATGREIKLSSEGTFFRTRSILAGDPAGVRTRVLFCPGLNAAASLCLTTRYRVPGRD